MSKVTPRMYDVVKRLRKHRRFNIVTQSRAGMYARFPGKTKENQTTNLTSALMPPLPAVNPENID